VTKQVGKFTTKMFHGAFYWCKCCKTFNDIFYVWHVVLGCLALILTRGMACVGKCFESKISKPTKLDCKQNFYCTVYYITLNSNCEAQRASKNLKKIVEDRVGSQK